MREITILSGKGGTGKTSITAALASFSRNTVFCDNDVDASDLHLIFQPEIKEQQVFYSNWLPEIKNERCTICRTCTEYCRFDAIKLSASGKIVINRFKCEGCRLCERVCKNNAISSKRNGNSHWFVSTTRFGALVHAKMGVGEENSGKLVTQVRKRAKRAVKESQSEFIISDGPPGIGCATISSLTGTDHVLLVTEPSRSGMHDAKRLIELVKQFKIPISAIINKCDINKELSKEIEELLWEKGVALLAKLPFDKKMVEAMVEGKTIAEYSPGAIISQKLEEVWGKIKVQRQ